MHVFVKKSDNVVNACDMQDQAMFTQKYLDEIHNSVCLKTFMAHGSGSNCQ